MTNSFHVLSSASQGTAAAAEEARQGGLVGLGTFLLALALGRLGYAGAVGESFGTEHALAFLALIAAISMLVADVPVARPSAHGAPKPRRSLGAWPQSPGRLARAPRRSASS